LITAALKGHVKCVNLLLTAGADKEAKTQKGYTAVIIAAQNGHDKCVKLLLTSGADKESKKIDGFTALTNAAQNGHDKCIECYCRLVPTRRRR
jgi:ankyrin repeat protein